MKQEVKIDAKEVMAKLAELQSDVHYIKEHIEDVSLSEDDLEAVGSYEEEKEAGKLVSGEDVKKELGL